MELVGASLSPRGQSCVCTIQAGGSSSTSGIWSEPSMEHSRPPLPEVTHLFKKVAVSPCIRGKIQSRPPQRTSSRALFVPPSESSSSFRQGNGHNGRIYHPPYPHYILQYSSRLFVPPTFSFQFYGLCPLSSLSVSWCMRESSRVLSPTKISNSCPNNPRSQRPSAF